MLSILKKVDFDIKSDRFTKKFPILKYLFLLREVAEVLAYCLSTVCIST